MFNVLEAFEFKGLDTFLKEVKIDFTSDETILKLGLQWMVLALWRWNLPRRQSNNTVCSRLPSLEVKCDRKIIDSVISIISLQQKEMNTVTSVQKYLENGQNIPNQYYTMNTMKRYSQQTCSRINYKGSIGEPFWKGVL